MRPVALAAALLWGVSPVLATSEPVVLESKVIKSTVVQTKVIEVVELVEVPSDSCPATYPDNSNPPAASPVESDGEATPSFVNTPVTTTLSPAKHWTHDSSKIENVVPIQPGQGSQMYYGVTDPSESGYYAHLTYNFKCPSVNLDHTDHVNVAYNADTGMVATFTSDDAFKRAVDSWSTKDGFILIAYVPGCGGYEQGERCYFKVTHLNVNQKARVITATGDSNHPDEITDSGETEWGWWNAAPKKDGPSTTAQGQPFAWGSATTASSSSAPTSTSSTGASQCKNPPDSKYGFKTACPGRTFDQILDDSLGYTCLNTESKQFLDLVKAGTNSSSPAVGALGRRSTLRRRGFFDKIKNGFKKVGDVLKKGAEAVKDVGEKIVDTAKTVADAISSVTIGGTAGGSFSWNITASSTPLANKAVSKAQSPWGDSVLLTSIGDEELGASLDVYCVGCGTSGHASVAGTAKWQPFHGIKEANLKMTMDMQLGLKIGIDAQVEIQRHIYQDIFAYGLPGLSFGVVAVGPYVSVGADVEVDVTAKGQILAGADMGMQNSVIVLDAVNSTNNQKTGWQPYVNPVFEANGEVNVTAQLGLPVGVKIGLKITTFEKAVGIVEVPSIKAGAAFGGYVNASKDGVEAGFQSIDGCSGVLTTMSWRNRLFVGWLDRPGIPTTDPLLDTGDRVFLRKCLGEQKPSAPKPMPSVAASLPPPPPPPMRFNRTSIAPANKTIHVPITPSHPVNSSSPLPPPSQQSSKPNYTFAELQDQGKAAKIVSCANGNLYPVVNDDQKSDYCFDTFYTTSESEIVYDGVSRSFHYYSDTMSKIGVSRLRVSNDCNLPNGAEPLALVSVTSSNHLYVGVDAQQEVFYPIVCHYTDGSASKLFVSKDLDAGLETLKQEEFMYSVTGGPVGSCELMALKP